MATNYWNILHVQIAIFKPPVRNPNTMFTMGSNKRIHLLNTAHYTTTTTQFYVKSIIHHNYGHLMIFSYHLTLPVAFSLTMTNCLIVLIKTSHLCSDCCASCLWCRCVCVCFPKRHVFVWMWTWIHVMCFGSLHILHHAPFSVALFVLHPPHCSDRNEHTLFA